MDTFDVISGALSGPFLATVRRRVFRQLISALLYEGALAADIDESGRYLVSGTDIDGNPVCYRFAAVCRHTFDRIRLDDGPLQRVTESSLAEADSVTRFLGEIGRSLPCGKDRLQNLALELEETQAKDASAEHVRALRNDVFAGATYNTLESIVTDGHLYHPTYKSRVGFDLTDNLSYGPEFGNDIYPLWLAARRSITRTVSSEYLSEDDFFTEELGHRVLAEFYATIRSSGETPADYILLAVHPWQWREHIGLSFATELRDRDLIVLGHDPNRYRAQQSIRTLACDENLERCYLKLSLSIVNTSTSRVLAPHTVCNAPAISDWLCRLAGRDEYLRDELKLILLGEVRGSVVDPVPLTELDRNSRYGKLACIWRDTIHTRMEPGESAVPFNGLTARQQDGTPLIDDWVRRFGLRDWVSRILETSVLPILHLLERHGIAMEAHAQNMVLIHRDGYPTRVALKDFHDGIRFCRSYLREPDECPCLHDVPPNHTNANSFIETTDPVLVEDFVLDSFFFINLGELAMFLYDSYRLDEREFWLKTRTIIEEYRRRYPNPEGNRTPFDVLKPEFGVEKLATRRLLPDTELRSHAVRNPLASVGGFDE